MYSILLLFSLFLFLFKKWWLLLLLLLLSKIEFICCRFLYLKISSLKTICVWISNKNVFWLKIINKNLSLIEEMFKILLFSLKLIKFILSKQTPSDKLI